MPFGKLRITMSLCGIQEMPTAQTAHLVFADTKANAEIQSIQEHP
jgi:hypothetical protein